jgi:hypothetical protein
VGGPRRAAAVAGPGRLRRRGHGAAARRERGSGPPLVVRPGLGAIAALLAGVALGAGAVRGLHRPASVDDESAALGGEETLADSYWQGLDEAAEGLR